MMDTHMKILKPLCHTPVLSVIVGGIPLAPLAPTFVCFKRSLVILL